MSHCPVCRFSVARYTSRGLLHTLHSPHCLPSIENVELCGSHYERLVVFLLQYLSLLTKILKEISFQSLVSLQAPVMVNSASALHTWLRL
ncbi:hypothetical protein IG631_15248 [Alternaria alternata]|nr:hypothetical protein IG631_15248 [Alternaria alternata]